jgi:hypothetical protein
VSRVRGGDRRIVWLRRVVVRKDGRLSCGDVRAWLRPRHGRERGEITEATEPRETRESLVIGTR